MNYYEEEVLIIPANKSGKLAEDPNCGIYECPANSKGQYRTRAETRSLYVAFRQNGKINHLYKIQDIVALCLGDTSAIDSLDNTQKYPNIKKRLNYYIQNSPSVDLTNTKYVFILDLNNTIELPYTVTYHSLKGKAGHEFRKLNELIRKPQKGSNMIYI